jgi:Zn-dependent peptidase ImmA (M78 family)
MATSATDVLRGLTVGDIRRKARQDAQEVLSKYWGPDTLPVDPVSVARSLGLSVFSAQLDDDVFGMLVGSEAGADIYLDKDQPRLRFRFTCAHEIGHYVLRSDEIARGFAFIDKRSDDDKGTPDEVYANEFAGSLLMPEAALRAAVNAGEDDFDLMRRFDVSLDALRYRRRILGF